MKNGYLRYFLVYIRMRILEVGSWLLKRFKGLSKQTKKMLLAITCILVGGSLPLPGTIKAGLVVGGILLFVKLVETPKKKSTKKKGKKKKKKKVSK